MRRLISSCVGSLLCSRIQIKILTFNWSRAFQMFWWTNGAREPSSSSLKWRRYVPQPQRRPISIMNERCHVVVEERMSGSSEWFCGRVPSLMFHCAEFLFYWHFNASWAISRWGATKVGFQTNNLSRLWQYVHPQSSEHILWEVAWSRTNTWTKVWAAFATPAPTATNRTSLKYLQVMIDHHLASRPPPIIEDAEVENSQSASRFRAANIIPGNQVKMMPSSSKPQNKSCWMLSTFSWPIKGCGCMSWCIPTWSWGQSSPKWDV